jgi:DNA polymerase III subunit delta'
LGKNLLARALAQSALCEQDVVLGEACRECAGCRLFEAGTHPDYRELIPEAEAEEGAEETAPGKKASQMIRIAAVRELAGLAGITAHRGGSRVVVISPAEALHPGAANALLKILEEPPAGMHFLLVSHEPHRLLKTVLSRCFQLAVDAPAEAEAVAWLEARGVVQPLLALALSGYGPFAAAELAGDEKFWSERGRFFDAFWRDEPDFLVLAEYADVIDPGVLARLLLMACHDLLAVRHGQPIRYHRDYAKIIDGRALKVRADAVAEWVGAILEFARAAYHPLNRRLALASLFAALPGS